MKDLENQINREKVPQHIAIIMDGNGRWAKKQGAERIFGHQNAIESVRIALKCCIDLGVKYLTLYVFSTENWDRPKNEIDALMGLLLNAIGDESPRLMKQKVKLKTIGDIKALPESTYNKLNEIIKQTSQNKKLELILALNYSGRWDLLNAVNNLLKEKHTKVNEKQLEQFLSTYNIPDPELLIRTSGEIRISNFLLWQIAYSEMYFSDVLWPDFTRENLLQAILTYQQRERRFGKVSNKNNSSRNE